MSHSPSIEGSSFVIAPMEGHDFIGDDFECRVCHRPRAMHRTGGNVQVHPADLPPGTPPLRCGFGIPRGKLLTDKKIAQYEKRGFYSEDFREARREFWARRNSRRTGNFLERDGRLVYSPI